MIDDCYLGRAHAQSGTGGVNGGVAAADDGYSVTIADDYLATVDTSRLIEAHTTQKPYGLAHSGVVDALDWELFGTAGAGAHEDGVEAFGKQVVDGVIASDGGLEMKFHAEIFDFLNLAAHHFLGQTIFWYAEHQHTARLGLHLENLHAVTFAREVAGNGQSGGSAAYDGYGASGLFRNGFVGETCLAVKVGHETFEFADVDVLAGLAEHTRALALTLMTTHAATHGREVAARVDDSH